MTQLSNGIYEDDAKNLVDIAGNILVLAEKCRPCLVYSRVVGYLTPVSTWNKGKRAEWADRVDFDPSLVRKARIVEVRPVLSMNTVPVVQTAEVGGMRPEIT